jgi:hypothetical protein
MDKMRSNKEIKQQELPKSPCDARENVRSCYPLADLMIRHHEVVGVEVG